MCESGSHEGEGIGRRFALVIQSTGAHTLPLVGRVGMRSMTGWGARDADRERP